MGLKQNKILLQQNCFSLKSAGVMASSRVGFANPSTFRNVHDSLGDLTSYPNGYSAGGAWVLPRTAGGLSSHNSAIITFSGTPLNVAQGLNIEGGSSVVFTGSSVTGAAVASGAGSSTVTFTAPAATAVAPINGVGSSTITFSGNAAALSAPTQILGASYFAFSGEALPTYAVGWMEAVPIDTSLSPASVAEAVWSASAAANNGAGTMGEKVNDAGSAGNPWSAELASNNASGTFGWLMQKVLTVSKFLALK